MNLLLIRDRRYAPGNQCPGHPATPLWAAGWHRWQIQGTEKLLDVPFWRYFFVSVFVELAEMDDRQDERIIQAFGQALKRIRLEKGYSTRELADRAEMNLGNLSDLELGKKNPLLTTVVRLADALGVDPGELLKNS